ncbi:MAG: ArsR/SmtB family transcription factor [Phycisphaerae bacterium]
MMARQTAAATGQAGRKRRRSGPAATPADKLRSLKAEVLAAAGHPIRLAIVEMLADGEVCVCEIAERLGAERSNVSRHLGVLTRAGLLSARKDGLRVLYHLRTPCILRFLDCVTDVVRQRLSEEQELLEQL